MKALKITDYIILIIVVAGLIYLVYRFVKKSNKLQIEAVKQWLIYACIEAEKLLGRKTGVLKLRYVYNLFISKFPFLALFLSFEYFSSLVDEALKTVEEQLEKNVEINKLVLRSDMDESKNSTID